MAQRAALQRAAEHLAQRKARQFVPHDEAADAFAVLRVVRRVGREHALVARRHRRQHAAAHAQAVEQHLDAVGLDLSFLGDRQVLAVDARVEVLLERVDARWRARELVVDAISRREVALGQARHEQANLLAILADARDEANERTVRRVRDPQLVAIAIGKQAEAAGRGIWLDVGADLLGVDANADLGEPERHQLAFGDHRQERALLLVGAVSEQRARADRQFARDLDRERAESVGREVLFGEREFDILAAEAAKLRGHREAVGLLLSDRLAQLCGQLAVRGECFAAPHAQDRLLDRERAATLGGLVGTSARLEFFECRQRPVDQPFDEALLLAAKSQRSLLRRGVERGHVARGLRVAGGGKRHRGGRRTGGRWVEGNFGGVVLGVHGANRMPRSGGRGNGETGSAAEAKCRARGRCSRWLRFWTLASLLAPIQDAFTPTTPRAEP